VFRSVPETLGGIFNFNLLIYFATSVISGMIFIAIDAYWWCVCIFGAFGIMVVF